MSAWLAAGLAGAAAALAVPPSPKALLTGRLGTARASPGLPRGRPVIIALAVLSGSAAATAAAITMGAASAIGAALAAAVAVVAGRKILAARKARQARVAQQHRVREACGILASELSAGQLPERALQAAAGVLPALGPVAATGRMGGDIPAALRAIDEPGTEALRQVAAAWSVAEHCGAGLAGVVAKVAHGLGADELLRREVATQLAAPRATARLLAGLPLLGLALGASVGSNPFQTLLGTPYGIACLVVGASLAGAGLMWVERLARRAERPP